MEKIHGLIDAPFTPFYENGEVNYEPIEAYCQLLVRNGLQGVFINGSSGEGYMLTEDERMKLAERWMEVAPESHTTHPIRCSKSTTFVLTVQERFPQKTLYFVRGCGTIFLISK